MYEVPTPRAVEIRLYRACVSRRAPRTAIFDARSNVPPVNEFDDTRDPRMYVGDFKFNAAYGR